MLLKTIELVSTSLLNPNRSYIPLSTDDPGSSSKDLNLVTVGLPPAWVDVSEEISANVQRARTKMAELAKAHAKALMPSFGDGKEEQRAIESEKRLQRLPAGGPSEDSNVRKNVQRSLATDLQNLSVELRKKQSTYLRRLRQQKEVREFIYLNIFLFGNKEVQDNIVEFMPEQFSINLFLLNIHQKEGFGSSKVLQQERMRAYILKINNDQIQTSDNWQPKNQIYGQDGVDLEINMNGSKSTYEDDDLDNMIFNEHQMAKLKKTEAFTVEREKEIQQLAQIMKDLSVLVIDQ
ncbi:hypothetical protein HN51_027367, partial [Arachis hypogaea]